MAAGDWLTDVLVGALGPGVNHPTFVLLNLIIGLAVLSLLALLASSIYSKPFLVPHVIVLLVLALGLWASINWLISNIGIVDAEQQKKELFENNKEQAEGQSEQQPGGGQEASGEGASKKEQ